MKPWRAISIGSIYHLFIGSMRNQKKRKCVASLICFCFRDCSQTNQRLDLTKTTAKVVEDVADKPEAMVVNTMLLRSMQQAKYSEENVGHYGLAAEDYTHFTSPIRRYPDLIVHRLIRSYSEDVSEANQNKWAEICLTSQCTAPKWNDEQSMQKEKSMRLKAEYMADKVGEEFDGIISSVVKFGLFIELPNTIEGLIHINNLKQDYFHYLENHLALVGERTGLTFKNWSKSSYQSRES